MSDLYLYDKIEKLITKNFKTMSQEFDDLKAQMGRISDKADKLQATLDTVQTKVNDLIKAGAGATTEQLKELFADGEVVEQKIDSTQADLETTGEPEGEEI
jgi:DNA anti-recombination protein RmuC